ncbi:MAG: SDR family oxidoreductase [Syntrophorhabdaceae bacterium]
MTPHKKNMLITGASGMLGSNLAYYFRETYNVTGLYNDNPIAMNGVNMQRVNILSEKDLRLAIDEASPDVLVHCVGLTNVDTCEIEHEKADMLNVTGTKVIADSIKGLKAKLIYVSSDSVYDGKKGMFSEADAVNPQNYYGMTKYLGELETLKIENSLVMRTNFFGWNIRHTRRSIAEWVMHELSHGNTIQGFNDVFFSSLYTFDLAKMLDISLNRDIAGIFNFGSAQPLSKHEFAIELSQLFGFDCSLIQAISIDEYSLKAKRGKNLTLNVDKFIRATGHTPPTLRESIRNFHRDHLAGLPGKIRNT